MKKSPLKIEVRKKRGFHVYRSDNPNLPFFLWKRITREPITTGNFSDHYGQDDEDKTYYYKITDVDIYGKESEPFDPPKAYWVKKDGTKIEKNDSNTIIGHHVYRSTDRNLPLKQWERLTKEPQPETSFTDTGLTGGVTYHYYVTSVNAQGLESKPSEIQSVTARE